MIAHDDFQHVLRLARSFVRDKVLPREDDIVDSDSVPQDLIDQARELGLFGYAIPPQWGGLGLSMSQEVELVMELAHVTQAFRSMLGTGNGIAGQVLIGYGTDEQRSTWLPRIATGEILTSFALTEEGAGSNPRALKTRAVPDGDGWILTGRKRYISHATSADLFMVFARVSTTDVGVYLMPAGSKGLSIGKPDRKMGGEGTHIADVTLDEVPIPGSAVVGGSATVGYRAAMASLARGRITVAAAAVGAAQRALEESVRHAGQTRQGDTPIGSFQLVQAMLADQQTQVLAGRSLVRHVASRFDDGDVGEHSVLPSAAKLFCSEMLGTVADLAVQVHGGSGYLRGTPVERIFREARVLRLFEGTSEIQRLIIGSRLVRDGAAAP